MKIATIINYCTNDYRFIKKCIDSVKYFSSQVIIPVCDHFYDGEPENAELLNKTYLENVDADFYEFAYKPVNIKYSSRHYCNIARYIGIKQLNEDIDWVLFLDSDEIAETKIFEEFLNNPEFGKHDSYKLACYFYFREPTYRAKQLEDPSVLIRKEYAKIDYNINSEREQLNEMISDKIKTIKNYKYKDQVMVHHFSWVRTKEEMLKKVKSWSHNVDRDWQSLVEEEFSRPFNGTDFIPYHHYDYEIVENKFKF